MEIENSSTSMSKKKSKKKNNKTKLNQNNNKMLDLDVISKNLEERLHIKQNGLIVNGEQHSSDEEIIDEKKNTVSSANNIKEKIQNNNIEKNGLDKISLQNNIVKDDKVKMNEEIGSNKIDVIEKCGCSNQIGCDDKNEKQLVVTPIPIVVTDESPSLNNILLNETLSTTSTSSLSSSCITTTTSSSLSPIIEYKEYESELQMPDIMRLIQKDLSEPYSIYTYRYFIHNWPKLCFLAMNKNDCVGAIVCKLDMHRSVKRGYIAMLAVDKDFRKLKIGSNLVQKAIQAMLNDDADEVVLETEITNIPALRLYENLGFVRDKRLFHYYLNGVDALRLKLWFR